MYTYLYYLVYRAIYRLRRPSRHSSEEIEFIVDAPAAGGGPAVRRGEEEAARPARRWTTRTATEPAGPGPARPAPATASTPAGPHQPGASAGTARGTAPAGCTGGPAGLRPPLLRTGRKQMPGMAEPVLPLLCLPYRLVTIFLV